VNLASRMESHGVPGRLQLSDRTRELIGDRFPLEDMGSRDIKGRGVMQTWMVRESS